MSTPAFVQTAPPAAAKEYQVVRYIARYDWKTGSGHVTLLGPEGEFTISGLGDTQFNTLTTLLRCEKPLFTDGLTYLTTRNEPVGENEGLGM